MMYLLLCTYSCKFAGRICNLKPVTSNIVLSRLQSYWLHEAKVTVAQFVVRVNFPRVSLGGHMVP